MAEFKKCDTCDAISPDKDYLHAANHWYEISAITPVEEMKMRRPAKYLICNDCMAKGVRLTDKGVTP